MKRILIVDDNLDTLNLVDIILDPDNSNIYPDFAKSSKEAEVFLKSNLYNAVILDISLPDITGYYLGQLIRNECPNMPIAFLTNYEGEMTKDNADFLEAKFWQKSEYLVNSKLLRKSIEGLCAEEACGNISIDIPSFQENIWEDETK